MEESTKIEPSAPAMVNPRVIALRKALEMSKSEFADILGVDRSSYSKMEKLEKPILPNVAHKIWELWHVDMNFIYLGQVRGLPSDLSSKIMTHLNGQNV